MICIGVPHATAIGRVLGPLPDPTDPADDSGDIQPPVRRVSAASVGQARAIGQALAFPPDPDIQSLLSTLFCGGT